MNIITALNNGNIILVPAHIGEAFLPNGCLGKW